MGGAVSWFGHRARELLVHLDRWGQAGRRPRVVFFPWGVPQGDSNELRVVNVARVLRARGWRCVVVPAQLELRQRLRIVRRERPDLIVLQKSRHPANRPGLYGGCPIVYDIDDADFLDERQTEAVADCCRGSAAVIAGSEFVARWCRSFNPNVHVVWTGTPAPEERPAVRPADRAPIVAWASTAPHAQPVDGDLVAGVLPALAARRGDVAFRCYGVDEPAAVAPLLDRLAAAGVAVSTFPRMPYPQFLRSLSEVAVGLAPCAIETPFNRGKSFGKVLAYLASDVAVAAAPELEHPRFFRHGENGMLPSDPAGWVDAVDRLLSDRALRQAIVDRARADFLRELTTEAAGVKVARVFAGVLGRPEVP